MNTDFIFIFLFSFFFLFIAGRLAPKIGLVDRPNYRKYHQGQIPLVGGISIYASCIFCFFLYTDCGMPHIFLYLTCAGVLVITGMIDDIFDISVVTRAIIQALVSIATMMFGGLYINSFGHILGSWEMLLGPFSHLMTLIAFCAAISAFNMMDGIDGLLGGLSCVSFSAMGIMFIQSGNLILARWCFVMIAAILPYILLNLGFLGTRYKVFMGDAGSTMIGFTIIWLILQCTQGFGHSMKPVTALWIIAVPLMDMIAILHRRVTSGVSPFSPDRQHIHHLIMQAGLSPRQAFITITFLATLLAFFGTTGEHYPESVMLFLWIMVFFLYSYLLSCKSQIKFLIKLSKRWLSHCKKIIH